LLFVVLHERDVEDIAELRSRHPVLEVADDADDGQDLVTSFILRLIRFPTASALSQKRRTIS
jgi:hypothetical protein